MARKKRKHGTKESHRYAQDHTVFCRPSCLIRFGPGGFLFENENEVVAAMLVTVLNTRPDKPTKHRNKI